MHQGRAAMGGAGWGRAGQGGAGRGNVKQVGGRCTRAGRDWAGLGGAGAPGQGGTGRVGWGRTGCVVGKGNSQSDLRRCVPVLLQFHGEQFIYVYLHISSLSTFSTQFEHIEIMTMVREEDKNSRKAFNAFVTCLLQNHARCRVPSSNRCSLSTQPQLRLFFFSVNPD